MNIPSRSDQKQKSTTFKIVFVLAGLSFFAPTGSIWHVLQFQKAAFVKTKKELKNLTKKATQDIEAIFRQAVGKVYIIANNMTTDKIGKSEILQQIQKLVLENSNYYVSTISCYSYSYEPIKRHIAPYFNSSNGDIRELDFTDHRFYLNC